MKYIGYALAFLIFIIIIIPLILVKSCGNEEDLISGKEIIKKNKDGEEIVNKIMVYVKQKDEVVAMDFNEYLKGVVAAEMPADFHIEALKAQAVAARTYAYYRFGKKDAYEEVHKGADICTDFTHCKAWISKDEAMKKWDNPSAKRNWAKISNAVEKTKNIIITYNDEPIDAVFHSTSSGKTENSEEVWVSTIPYLRSVPSYGEHLSPRYTSEVKVPIDEFIEKITAENPDVHFNGSIDDAIGIPERTEGGSVSVIDIGGCTFKGTEIRRIFKLNSANFLIRTDSENIIFDVTGNGHGVGMSQYGANYLAKEGKTYEEILKHYYKDIELVFINR